MQQHVSMEHQQREPVDGGNEAVPSSLPPLSASGLPTSAHLDFDDNINMPMERLVLVRIFLNFVQIFICQLFVNLISVDY